MSNKFLLSLTAISLSFAGFLSGYFFSQKDLASTKGDVKTGSILEKFSGQNTVSLQENSFPKGFVALTRGGVISPVLSQEKNSILYYDEATGRPFEADLKELKERPLSENPLSNLVKTIWSPNRKEVVSVFYAPSGNNYKYYSYRTKTSHDLGSEIKSLVFSPDGSQIAYFKEGGIFISQPDGSSFKKILNTRLEQVQIYWPLNEYLYLVADTKEGSELYRLSKEGEILKILDARRLLNLKWSSDGTKLAFSYDSGSGTGLFYISEEGKEMPLLVSTSATKCVWSVDSQTIICGVPTSSGSGDELYEIKLDGTKKLIASANSKINIEDIFLSGSEDHIAIHNRLDNRLYVLKLVSNH